MDHGIILSPHVQEASINFFWQIGRCTCHGLLRGRWNGSGQDTKGDKKHQVDVYQLFDTMQVE